MPKLLKTPFAIDAAEGFRTDIQESTGAAPNSATYQVGFPPVTMQSIASNGMPPKGSDLNGVLYDITDNLVFLTQGGGYGFDAAYATSIGGYPLNARLQLDDGAEVISTIPSNTNNPNSDMTGWVLDRDLINVQSKEDLATLKLKLGTSVFVVDEQSFFISKSSSAFSDGFMVINGGGVYWERQPENTVKLNWFLNSGESANLAFPRLISWLSYAITEHYVENGSEIRKIQVDLCGNVHESSSEILIDNRLFSGLTFTNGTLKAADDFTGTYLVRMQHSSVDLAFYYTYFDDVIFDGNNVASCAKVNNFLKCGFSGKCQFIRWKPNGIGLIIGSTLDEQALNPSNVHEVIGDQLVFMQQPYEDIAVTNTSTGTALINAAPDGHISNVVVSSSGKGILNLCSGLNLYDKIHVYGLTEPDYGFWMDNTGTNFISTHLNNLYLDGCALYILNPRQISISSSTIFRHDSNTNGLIIFEASESNVQISHFISTRNTFNTTTANRPEVEFRTSGSGSWNQEQNIQSFANMYYGTVVAFKAYSPETQESWKKTDGLFGLANRYPIDQSGSFTFDLTPYHNLNRGVGFSAVPSEWLIISSYQANNGDDFGVYKVIVVRLPTGNYMAQVQQVGANSGGISNGFASAPTVSSAGILTVVPSSLFKAAIYRIDSRNVISI